MLSMCQCLELRKQKFDQLYFSCFRFRSVFPILGTGQHVTTKLVHVFITTNVKNENIKETKNRPKCKTIRKRQWLPNIKMKNIRVFNRKKHILLWYKCKKCMLSKNIKLFSHFILYVHETVFWYSVHHIEEFPQNTKKNCIPSRDAFWK